MRKKEILLKSTTGYRGAIKQKDALKAMQEYTDEFACAFADYLVKNYQPRFPNKGEWVKIIDSNKFKRVYTTTELLEIFKQQINGKV